jgi:hypothetical protein
MALTDFQEAADNSYEEVFSKILVAKSIANMRFEPKLKFGESVERFIFDISGVRVRTVVRGNASTIDAVTDSTELLTINIEKEAAFHISDGEATQAGPLNPGEVIGSEVAKKVATDLDARVFAEVGNASQIFDTGDLTTMSSNGTPISLTSTTVPQMVTRMPAKLKKDNQVLTNMAFVLDAYGVSDIEQYLLGKQFDIVNSVFKNGYSGAISQAEVFVSENLTSEAVLTSSGVFVNTQTVVINGITFTSVDNIGVTAGNFLIGADAAASLTNLAGLINNPGTTSSTQVALSAADQVLVTDVYRMVAVATATTVTVTCIGGGRMTVSETQTNVAWGTAWLKCFYGKKGSIDLVVQNLSKIDMRPTSDRRGTNIFTSYLAGIKTFADGAKKFLHVKVA